MLQMALLHSFLWLSNIPLYICATSITYMYNLEKKKLVQRTYLQNRERFMDLENQLMITKGER